MQYKPNPVGFHTALTPEVHDRIISAIPAVLTPNLVAKLARIPKRNLQNWLRRGQDDINNETDSIFAQLLLDFEQKVAQCAEEFINDLRDRKTNWQATHELLRVIARDDFGQDAIEYKELLALYAKLRDDFKRITDNPTLSRNDNHAEKELD